VRSPRSADLSRGSQTYSSSGMQYWQRKLQRSVTEMRRLRSGRPWRPAHRHQSALPPARLAGQRAPLADQARLPHPHVEVIPGHPLVAARRRVQNYSPSTRAGPVSSRPRDRRQLQEVPPGVPGRGRLQRGLPRSRGGRGRSSAALPLDDVELGLQRAGPGEGRPLEGRPGLGDERRDRQGQPPERLAGRIEHAEASEQPRGEVRDGLDVLPRLRGLTDHEVTLEIGDAVAPDHLAGRVELLVADLLANGARSRSVPASGATSPCGGPPASGHEVLRQLSARSEEIDSSIPDSSTTFRRSPIHG
jgi:hypothetical protein